MHDGQTAAADRPGLSAAAPARPTLRELVLPSLLALRSVWVPFVLILLLGVAFVISYYTIPAVKSGSEVIASLKERMGYGFSALGGLIAGVIFPETFRRLTIPGHRIFSRWRDVLLDIPYFVFMALLVDTLYRLLAMAFGTEVNVPTVAAKTVIDQFVFTPLLGVVIPAVYFPLRKNGWSLRRVLGGFGWDWYLRNVVPLLLPAWVFWIPAVILIYSLPPPLRMPFTLCATAAWSLLMVVIAKREVPAPAR